MPIFATFTKGLNKKDLITLCLRSTLTAFGILLLFWLFGSALLQTMGININSFRIVGGMFLMVIAYQMVFEQRQKRREETVEEVMDDEELSSLATFPIAIPLIAGPGAITLVMFTLILMAINVQVENSEDKVSFRLGPEDSTYEIIQELKYGDEVNSTIKNLDDSLLLEVVYINVEDSAKAMENGSIDWQYLTTLGEHHVINPGQEIYLTTDTPLFYHLIVMHNPSNSSNDILEVSVANDYHDNQMWKAIILSIPSLWMTAFVIHRLQRLKLNSRSFVDSSPSHLWLEQE